MIKTVFSFRNLDVIISTFCAPKRFLFNEFQGQKSENIKTLYFEGKDYEHVNSK